MEDEEYTEEYIMYGHNLSTNMFNVISDNIATNTPVAILTTEEATAWIVDEFNTMDFSIFILSSYEDEQYYLQDNPEGDLIYTDPIPTKLHIALDGMIRSYVTTVLTD